MDIGKISLLQGWSSTGQAVHGTGGFSVPRRHKNPLDVAPGDIGEWWPWLGGWLDSMLLEVIFNLTNSVIYGAPAGLGLCITVCTPGFAPLHTALSKAPSCAWRGGEAEGHILLTVPMAKWL